MELRDILQDAFGDAYTLERELGGGGMSRVFLARDTALDRRVVVKVLPPELASAVSGERFNREIRVAAQLQHPHIVPLLSAGQVGDLTFFTMPFVNGESLRARVASGALPAASAVRTLRDVAAALAYAHKNGVVHRDIKPDNVLLSEGYAVVTDFGVAKALTASTNEGDHLTSLGVALGTPAYMAPEQAAAEPTVDHRADIYSFGILAYEMLSGTTPFAGRPASAQLAAQVTEQAEPLAKRVAGLPAGLTDLVGRCLAKDPGSRPQSADEIVRELDQIAMTMPTPDATHPARARLGSRQRRPRILLTGVALVMAGVAAAVAAWGPWTPAGPTLDDRLIAVFPFRVSSPDPSLAYLEQGMPDLFAITLSTEAGMRTSDVSAVLAAWRRSGGQNAGPEEHRHIASSLSAGQYITGEIVGTQQKFVIRAVLHDTESDETALATAEGRADDVSVMVDGLTAQLLSRRAGEAEELLPTLQQTSLPALRSYLAARSAYRQANFGAAADSFQRALEYDSTFAPAAFGLAVTSSWTPIGVTEQAARRARAWRLRDRLPPADRLYMEAEFGTRAPGISPITEQLAAAERLVRIAQDRSEAWYILGDLTFHFSAMMDRPDGMQQALFAFNRSLQLDSSFFPAAEHLQTIYHRLGDTAGVRRATQLLVARDSSSERVEAARWYQESVDGVPTSELRLSTYGLIRMHAMTDGIGVHDYGTRLDSVVRSPLPSSARRWFADAQREMFLNGGRPRQAREADAIARSDPGAADTRILHAMFWDGDSTAAAESANDIETALGSWRTVAPQRALQQATSLAVWAAARGEPERLNRALVVLRQLAALGDSVRQTSTAQLMILTVEALAADRNGLPQAAALLAKLDSAALTVPAPAFWVTIANMVALRLWDRRGDYDRALAASRRRVAYYGAPAFLTTMLREEGRLAELTGDREGAIRAYTLYLTLRPNPAPEWQADTEAIAARLDALKRESAGR